jgi:hypothetical protein
MRRIVLAAVALSSQIATFGASAQAFGVSLTFSNLKTEIVDYNPSDDTPPTVNINAAHWSDFTLSVQTDELGSDGLAKIVVREGDVTLPPYIGLIITGAFTTSGYGSPASLGSFGSIYFSGGDESLVRFDGGNDRDDSRKPFDIAKPIFMPLVNVTSEPLTWRYTISAMVDISPIPEVPSSVLLALGLVIASLRATRGVSTSRSRPSRRSGLTWSVDTENAA